ncbi:secondary thiamine-phosphate synthase enzyme [Halanaerobium saccharolyticum]|uniref:Secondary thiamine-phosphate synthase enzyme n=1 Tax=Halanaerobium saccharolyticum TaxID=43595 RepID=A0A4R7YN41_9FIRM|nr:secondary thiamine-phosphate synthase enzyme YjbQ [Halanaerobium saccharolyticum]RAK05105.1 secondary thiamine-phosphate synthase enzyme [Halanaerobium saccharolyticum]TDV98872.1 secondary thiamine-phosphate synthase enzyme [Halanaerobium saccharolyticum]TDX51574.1 secondary thiamine-phosphate synthase enzyme [Halanaerobium saccharolyticum]
MFTKLSIKTNNKVELIDITNEVQRAVQKAELESGLVEIHIPHTTAAVTINENADPDVKADIKKEINKIVPFDDNYSHLEGNSAAHIKSSLFGVNQSIIVENKKLLLGTWQGIYFCEFDGPRSRNIYLKIIRD